MMNKTLLLWIALCLMTFACTEPESDTGNEPVIDESVDETSSDTTDDQDSTDEQTATSVCASDEDCAPLIVFARSGGICAPPSICGHNLAVYSHGYAFLSGYSTEEVGMDATASQEVVDQLISLMEAVDWATVQDGYGECCNAHWDGQDDYLTMHLCEGVVREIRVSVREEAPQAILDLLDYQQTIRDSITAPTSGDACVQ